MVIKYIKITYNIILFALIIALTSCAQPQLTTKQVRTSPDSSASETNITSYTVNKNNTITFSKNYPVSLPQDIIYQQKTDIHMAIWEDIKKIISSTYLAYLQQFIIFNGEKNRVGGYVSSRDSQLKKWDIGIAINLIGKSIALFNYYTIKQSHYIITHEFAHLLSLNGDQIDTNISKNACTTVYIFNACAKETSYIYAFYKDFWKDNETKWKGKTAKEIHKENLTSFTGEYAATAVYEDFAESFAYFVLVKNIPPLLPTSLGYDKKAHFFNRYEKTKNMKTTIRTNLNLTKDEIKTNSP